MTPLTPRDKCTHEHAYFKETSGVDYCYECNSFRMHGFYNKKTGERVGHSISGEQSATGDFDVYEEWVEAPGRRESVHEYAHRQEKISRAFGERWVPDTRRRY